MCVEPELCQGRVSVIVPSFNSGVTIAATLEALSNQEDAGDFEVIVVDSSESDDAASVIRRFPAARLIRLAQRAYPGGARNIGVKASTGEILAFTDADCAVGQDWIHEIRVAHQTGIPIIGGTIANANPESLIGWMYFFCKFSHWLPTRSARPMSDIPTSALTMRRRVYDEFGPFLEDRYSSDSAFNWNATASLVMPLLSPRLQVGHKNFTNTGRVVSKLFQHGRDYARVRANNDEWSRWRRLLYVVAAPALPVLLFVRTTRNVWSSRAYSGQFVAMSPLVVCGYIVWSLGELVGYATAGHAI